MGKLHIVCAVVVVLVAFCGFSAAMPPAPHSQNFDYLLLVQQWGYSFCAAQGSKCQVPSGLNWWTLHGMWPENNDTTYPSNCNSSYPFDPSQIAPIKSQLVKYWPNMLSDANYDDFWSHEWVKHGTCAAEFIPAVNNEYKFFLQALKTRQQCDVAAALSAAGITPSNSQTYTVDQIRAAIQARYGVTPVLGCTYARSLQAKVLSELAFCVSKSFNIIQCNSQVINKGFEEKCDDGFLLVASSYY